MVLLAIFSEYTAQDTAKEVTQTRNELNECLQESGCLEIPRQNLESQHLEERGRTRRTRTTRESQRLAETSHVDHLADLPFWG